MNRFRGLRVIRHNPVLIQIKKKFQKKRTIRRNDAKCSIAHYILDPEWYGFICLCISSHPDVGEERSIAQHPCSQTRPKGKHCDSYRALRRRPASTRIGPHAHGHQRLQHQQNSNPVKRLTKKNNAGKDTKCTKHRNMEEEIKKGSMCHAP